MIGGECVGLATSAVEREHELRAQALAEGMLRDECLELSDQVATCAERELRVDQVFKRGGAQVLEPANLVQCEGLEDQVGERGTAPQR